MQNSVDTKQLRSFGLIVGGIFAVIGLWPALVRGEEPRLWVLLLAGLLLVPALAVPRVLQPIYRIWMAIGHILGWINTRIILGVIFYAIFTPVAQAMRLMGKDPMRRRFEPEVDTYRVMRQSRPRDHMIHQF